MLYNKKQQKNWLKTPNMDLMAKFLEKELSMVSRIIQKTPRRICSITEGVMISNEAKWHGSCYSETIHSSMLKRAKYFQQETNHLLILAMYITEYIYALTVKTIQQRYVTLLC